MNIEFVPSLQAGAWIIESIPSLTVGAWICELRNIDRWVDGDIVDESGGSEVDGQGDAGRAVDFRQRLHQIPVHNRDVINPGLGVFFDD